MQFDDFFCQRQTQAGSRKFPGGTGVELFKFTKDARQVHVLDANTRVLYLQLELPL